MEQFNPVNKQAHLVIAHEIIKKQNGVFTFTIRVNGKQIVDLVIREINGNKT